jgi:hypothetical protein
LNERLTHLPGELLHARFHALDAAGVANELHERLEGHGLALRERGAVVEEVGRVLLVHRCVMVIGGGGLKYWSVL